MVQKIEEIPESLGLLKCGINIDWLISGIEDWYVNVPATRRALSEKDPNKPVVFSSLGCSQEW
jgi:hypothetical protein